jgi:hypothetical protein
VSGRKRHVLVDTLGLVLLVALGSGFRPATFARMLSWIRGQVPSRRAIQRSRMVLIHASTVKTLRDYDEEHDRSADREVQPLPHLAML